MQNLPSIMEITSPPQRTNYSFRIQPLTPKSSLTSNYTDREMRLRGT